MEKETIELQGKEVDYLDYGVHWFNANNVATKAYDEKNDQTIEVSSNFYDDTKPTVVYFHGWQSGSATANYDRGSFNYVNDDGLDINTVRAWKEKGWNVGIFYWDQFADELELKNAEAKIWSVNGNQKMRYQLNDGTFSTLQSPTNSLGKEAFKQLSTLLANNTSNDVRFVGHSLGNQLATYATFLFSEAVDKGQINKAIMPKRLELLDPFWSKGGKSYLGDYNGDGNNDWNGERVKWYIQEMIKRDDLAVTWYDSSPILSVGIGDGNNSLKDYVAFQSERYWYVNVVGVAEKHVNVVHDYFWSYKFDAPKEVKLNWLKIRRLTGKVAASASTSTTRIKEMMGDSYVWDQVEGRYTATPEDDLYELKNW